MGHVAFQHGFAFRFLTTLFPEPHVIMQVAATALVWLARLGGLDGVENYGEKCFIKTKRLFEDN